MKRTFSVFAVVLFSGFAGHSALAYCRSPGNAPEAPRAHHKPNTPNCLENVRYGEEHDCDQYALDRYRREVDRYVQDLEDYAEEARRYSQEAEKYARCEMAEIRETLN